MGATVSDAADSVCGNNKDSNDDKRNSDIPLKGNATDSDDMKRSVVSKKGRHPRVLIIQNDVLCPPCSAISALVAHEIPYQVIYAFHELAFKHIDPLMYEAIIILGGRCAVYESHKIKWLENEMKFVKKALIDKVPILGICLGCQILAACAGGKVMKGDKGIEIGYEDWVFSDNDIDPFYHALKYKNLDKFVILFHGDTFTLPDKCVLNGQTIQLLASTEKYKTLYKIGKYSYGFQGHPELNYDMVRIWTKAWGDDFLHKSEKDIDKDVLQYSKKHRHTIDQNSKILFDIWIDIALIHCTPTLTRGDTQEFDQYAKDHWNSTCELNIDKTTFPVTYSGFFGTDDQSI